MTGGSEARRRPVVSVDLSDLDELSDEAVDLLDHLFHRVAGGGWEFLITPPQANVPFRAFVRAAIDGRFGWARGGEPGVESDAGSERCVSLPKRGV